MNFDTLSKVLSDLQRLTKKLGIILSESTIMMNGRQLLEAGTDTMSIG
jgi:hypothetical protein